MRKLYSKSLKIKFAKMVAALPMPFQKFQGQSEYLFPSQHAYVHRVDSKLLFLILNIHTQGEQSFTVEFGWSSLGRYPEVLSVRFPDMEAKAERFVQQEYLQRIGVFVGYDHWWYLEGDRKDWQGHLDCDKCEISPQDVDAAVDRAIDGVKELLERKTLPYFQEYIERTGRQQEIE